jgi:hypothetical protein
MRFAPLASAALLILGAIALAPDLHAQETSPPAPVGATGRAFELGISGGFADGWGSLNSPTPGGVRVPGSGGQLEIDAGVRVLPNLALGAYGFGGQLSDSAAIPITADVFAAGAGLQGTVHLRPAARDADPWLSLGAGWRGQYLSFQGGNGYIAQDGVDMFRARVGVDLRVSPTLALSPVLGASLSTFVTESIQGAPWTSLHGFPVNTFVFGGVRATLDIPFERKPGQATIAIP